MTANEDAANVHLALCSARGNYPGSSYQMLVKAKLCRQIYLLRIHEASRARPCLRSLLYAKFLTTSCWQRAGGSPTHMRRSSHPASKNNPVCSPGGRKYQCVTTGSGFSLQTAVCQATLWEEEQTHVSYCSLPPLIWPDEWRWRLRSDMLKSDTNILTRYLMWHQFSNAACFAPNAQAGTYTGPIQVVLFQHNPQEHLPKKQRPHTSASVVMATTINMQELACFCSKGCCWVCQSEHFLFVLICSCFCVTATVWTHGNQTQRCRVSHCSVHHYLLILLLPS